MKKVFDYEETFMGLTPDRSPGLDRRIYQYDHRFRKFVDTVKLAKGRIIDVGCGGGSFIESLANYYPNVHMYGCDISKKAIFYAKKTGSGKVNYGVIRNGKFPYKDDFFDVLICVDVLEHVPDVHFFLNEVRRVLKKKGLFYLAVPCEGEPLTYTWFLQKIGIGDKLTFKHFGHIHPEFTHRFVRKLLNQHKLKIVDTSYDMHFLSQVFMLLQYFLPKELLNVVLGNNRAAKYYDKSVVIAENQKKLQKDPIYIFREVWFGIWRMLSPVSLFEFILFNKVSITSWRLLALSQKLEK